MARLVGSGMFVMVDVLSRSYANALQVLLVLLSSLSSIQYAPNSSECDRPRAYTDSIEG